MQREVARARPFLLEKSAHTTDAPAGAQAPGDERV